MGEYRYSAGSPQVLEGSVKRALREPQEDDSGAIYYGFWYVLVEFKRNLAE